MRKSLHKIADIVFLVFFAALLLWSLGRQREAGPVNTTPLKDIVERSYDLEAAWKEAGVIPRIILTINGLDPTEDRKYAEQWFEQELHSKEGKTTVEHKRSRGLAKGHVLLFRTLLVLILSTLATCCGLFVFISACCKGRLREAKFFQIHPWPIAASWPGGAGGRVLLFQTLLVTVPIAILFSIFAASVPVSTVCLFWSAVTMYVTRAILQQRNWKLADVLGLGNPERRAERLFTITLILFALNSLFSTLIYWIFKRFGVPNHWTEWYHDVLALGSFTEVGITIVIKAVLSPAFEELLFRGVFFAILRRYLACMPAVVLSAVIFSVAHGFELSSSLGLFFCGALWSYSYEKTGSLWPAFLSHALGNLIFCLSVLAFFR